MVGGGASAAKRCRGGDGSAEDAGGVSFTALHRSRMFHWNPSAVAALSGCPGAPMVAVGYESGDLELWDLALMACIQRVVGEGIEVTSLAWARDNINNRWRTFVAHLDGTISEVDWAKAALVGTLDTAGGVAWALASQPVEAVKPGYPHLIAAACDDGAVRLFGVEGEEPGAQLDRTLTVLHGRLLSCAWHPSGEVIAVGGVEGTVHVLDAVAGSELVRITVSSKTSAGPPCVWRLLILADGTLVSGDSEGTVQLWDMSFGTLIQRFQRHQADVLALAAAPDGSSLFASGVDSQVVLFQPVRAHAAGASATADSWAYIDTKRPHTHDVRAMDVVQIEGGRSVLVSGGLDTQLVAYVVGTFRQTHPVRLSKAPQRPVCQLATAAAVVGEPQRRPPAGTHGQPAASAQPVGSGPRLLSSHNDCCDIWQLGRHAPVGSVGGAMWSWREPQQPAPAEGSSVDLASSPRHLAQVRLADGARVACSAISPDGSYVACCSGQGKVRLYNLYRPEAAAGGTSTSLQLQPPLNVRRVSLPVSERAVALALTNRYLIAAQPDGTVQCLELPSSQSASVPLGAKPSGSAGAQSQPLKDADDGEASVRLVGTVPAPESSTARSHQSKGLALWRQYQPPITILEPSSDGTVVAMAGPAGVSLLALPSEAQPEHGHQTRKHKQAIEAAQGSLRILGKPLRPSGDGPIAGIAFNPDGRYLAAALAGGQLSLWEVQAGKPTQWSLDNESAVNRCLDKLPGPLIGCCFNPDPKVQQLVVYSPGGFCHFDLAVPIDTAHLDVKKRRTRIAPTKGAEEKQGRNGRAILLPDPCVLASYLSVDSLIVLEKPWEDVTRTLAPPLLRHRLWRLSAVDWSG